MDPITIGYLSIAGIIILILMGFHIGVALAGISFIGIWMINGRFLVASHFLKLTSYNALADYVFAVIPLFVVMGLFAAAAGITRDLFLACDLLLRRVRGGLGVATVAANAVFAAVTGTSIASAAVFSRLAIPEMDKLGYNRRFSLGIVGSSALLGMLIPPSVLMIVYALVTEQSIGRLFAAGVVPGLLVAGVLAGTIWLRATINPDLVGGRERRTPLIDVKPLVVFSRTIPVVGLIFVVLGGMYGGLFTPTEAGAVGAVGAFLLMVVLTSLKGQFRASSTFHILLEAGRATAGIFFLIIAAKMYSRMITLAGLPRHVTEFVMGADIPPYLIILVFILIIIILGFLIDAVSILLLTMPIMLPVVMNLGYDPIHFGIIAIVAVELGLLTPPFGIVVFAMKASLGKATTVEEIFKGVTPFFFVLLATLAVIVLVPEISLWLPRLIYG